MKKIISLLLLSPLLFVSLNSCSSSSSKNKGGTLSDLDVNSFEQQLLALQSPQLIDVRTPGEYEQGFIKGAVNADLSSGALEQLIPSLDKNKEVFVYCLSGGRSSSAADYLHEQGFAKVYNLNGGLVKWNAAGKHIQYDLEAPKAEGMKQETFKGLTQSKEYVLVDYRAEWCKPCVVMAPMLDSIAAKHAQNLLLLKIDADENKDLLRENQIESLPVLELYKNGIKVWSHQGLISGLDLQKQTGL